MSSPTMLPHDEAGDGDASSASEGHESPTPSPSLSQASALVSSAVKKRKVTYYQRKDEIEELQYQVTMLQEYISRLQGHVSGEAHGIKTLAALYRQNIECNSLRLAGTQAMLSAHYKAAEMSTMGEATVPLTRFIHLPTDVVERSAVMNEMRADRLRAAHRFLVERTRGLDLSQGYRQVESFELPHGDRVAFGFNILQFESGHSLRQVYDAFMFFVSNQEISISENLGELTVLESEELEDFKYGSSRFLSTISEELEIESNIAMFATFEDTPEDGIPPYGLCVVDYVNQDDLYPYRPDLCGRKDLTAAVLLIELQTDAGRVIAMAKWTHVRFRAPTFPISKTVRDTVSDTMMDWCEVIPKVIRERLSLWKPAR